MHDLSLRDGESPAGIAKWIHVLGITDAPVPRDGIGQTLRFLHHNRPRHTPHAHWALDDVFGFLAAMDLSRPVVPMPLGVGRQIIAFRFPAEAEFKLFYTLPGGSPYNSGILPDGRRVVRFRVTKNGVKALHSYTTGALDSWSERTAPLAANSPWRRQTGISTRLGEIGRMVGGGGQQLLIPNAAEYLTVDDGRR
jgi:hypothetical protein